MTIASIPSTNRANPGFEPQIAPQELDVRETTDAYVAPRSARPLSPSDFDVPSHWQRYAQASRAAQIVSARVDRFLADLSLAREPFPDIPTLLTALRARSTMESDLAGPLRAALAYLHGFTLPATVRDPLLMQMISTAMDHSFAAYRSSPITDRIAQLLPRSLLTKDRLAFQPILLGQVQIEHLHDARNLVMAFALERQRRLVPPDAPDRSQRLVDYRQLLEDELPRPESLPSDTPLFTYYDRLLNTRVGGQALFPFLSDPKLSSQERHLSPGAEKAVANRHALVSLLLHVEMELEEKYWVSGASSTSRYAVFFQDLKKVLDGLIKEHPDTWERELLESGTITAVMLPLKTRAVVDDLGYEHFQSAVSRAARIELAQRQSAREERDRWERTLRRR